MMTVVVSRAWLKKWLQDLFVFLQSQVKTIVNRSWLSKVRPRLTGICQTFDTLRDPNRENKKLGVLGKPYTSVFSQKRKNWHHFAKVVHDVRFRHWAGFCCSDIMLLIRERLLSKTWKNVDKNGQWDGLFLSYLRINIIVRKITVMIIVMIFLTKMTLLHPWTSW